MGHIRLGRLPRTRKWLEVVEEIGVGGGAPAVAAATMDAAHRGLEAAAEDPGLVHSVWLLTQIPLAARAENFSRRIEILGLKVPAEPTLLELVAGFTRAVDRHLLEEGGRSDLGEMAELAAAEALTALGTRETAGIFAATPADVKRAIRAFSTKQGFKELGSEFFARLVRKYLMYFLSRELSNHVSADGRFKNIGEHEAFNDALDRHCREASRIVEEFAGGWFSKANFEGGITKKKAAGFAGFALKKLQDELEKGQGHGD